MRCTPEPAKRDHGSYRRQRSEGVSIGTSRIHAGRVAPPSGGGWSASVDGFSPVPVHGRDTGARYGDVQIVEYSSSHASGGVGKAAQSASLAAFASYIVGSFGDTFTQARGSAMVGENPRVRATSVGHN